ncbi:hypothetical protein AWM79_23480 [Pseudomonas agarici]|uniref:Heat-shock protein HtpX n=1 Tax=Pseudomonas agarici TaxID=46677 RepID=A0A0X1T7K8_PSEAA|nr:copper-binding protein [Pseudomonas agarici]AMB88076.1 hypothetical protein AWM79_23480 [Pseudomonas agarici]NWB92963.1 copper-binding protein [Pseudomonas agarici]NWC09230.1 copper-binding protein [Pseudomonas agarici]SEK31076.1 Cu(I)/Ag(I) efflux system protein CusF [Pseudomonas agarici]
MKLTLMAVVATVAALSFNAYAEEMNRGGESMQDMNMSPAAKAMSATKTQGIIKAIDAEKHTVTIAHEAIPAIKWPAMTMAFSTTANQIVGLSSGDHVAFTFDRVDGTAKIESIEKMK